MSRFGIILMFALLLVLGGGMLSIPLLVREPLPILGPRAPITVERAEGGLPTVARLEVEATGRLVMLFALEAEDGAEVPRLVLEMPDHKLAPMEASVEAVGGNRFRATASLTMPGRWEVSLEQAGARQSFQFILRDF